VRLSAPADVHLHLKHSNVVSPALTTNPATPPAGVLFEASQLLPPATPSIHLAEPGPRAATRLWVALLEALIYADTAVGTGSGVVGLEGGCAFGLEAGQMSRRVDEQMGGWPGRWECEWQEW